ncbi:MAG: hypothetical protein J6U22_09705 [Bacteroidaceae bacterium]|nr:hypothetical protein [Bacteroidaceae bacterium]
MDKTVIIIMIICATLIALVAIICDYLFERKSTDASECLMSKKIIKVHRNYIAGFLGFAIIMLLTAQYGGPNNAIFAYLSFGSTITSLVLSILAIFVTVQSSSDLYKQFTRIDNATDTINKVSYQIEKTLNGMSESEKQLKETSQEISSQMDEIVNRIDERIKVHMQETEHNLSEQISSMNEQTISMDDASAEETTDINVFIDNLKNGFLNSISGTGALLVYVCCLSSERNKEFLLSDLLRGNEQYAYGFLISTLSIGLVSATVDEKLKVKCFKTEIGREAIVNKLQEMVQRFGQDFLSQINIANRYFGVEEMVIELKPQKQE